MKSILNHIKCKHTTTYMQLDIDKDISRIYCYDCRELLKIITRHDREKEQQDRVIKEYVDAIQNTHFR